MSYLLQHLHNRIRSWNLLFHISKLLRWCASSYATCLVVVSILHMSLQESFPLTENGQLLNSVDTLKIVSREDHIILSQLCASFSIFLHSLTHDSSVPLAFKTPVVLRRCWAWHNSLFFSSSWIHVAQEQQTTNKGYRPTNHNHFVLYMKNIQNKRKKKSVQITLSSDQALHKYNFYFRVMKIKSFSHTTYYSKELFKLNTWFFFFLHSHYFL